jgi:hypothetical protein
MADERLYAKDWGTPGPDRIQEQNSYQAVVIYNAHRSGLNA